MPELVRPSERYKDSFLNALREAQEARSGLSDTLAVDLSAATADFGALLAGLRQYEPGRPLPEGFVPSETFWLVEEGEYLGRVNLRHTLNDRLREAGGHIGYEIRPSARGRGHATLALHLALARARDLGLDRVLVTCDVANLGSRRVIEKCGGVLEGEFMVAAHAQPIRRYWIAL